MAEASTYLYVSPRLDGIAIFSSDALAGTTERHRLLLDPGDLTGGTDPLDELARRNHLGGIVIGLASGLPDRRRLEIAEAALTRGARVWLHWPDEQAVACVTPERMKSLWRHRRAVIALEKVGRRAHRVMKSWERIRPGLRWIYRGAFPVRRYDLLPTSSA